MATNMTGLFGVDPNQYAQEQLMAQTKYNQSLATMDPLSAGKFTMMQAASQLGNMGQQMLGIEDPTLKAATELKALASQADLTTPKGMMQFARTIASKYPQQAQQAAARAQEMQVQQATVYQKMGENMNSLISSGKFTPESLAKYKETRDPGDLVPFVAPEKMGESTIKEVATAEKNNTVLTNSNKQLDDWISQTEKGEVKFGLGARATAIGQRIIGTQNENTQKLDSLSKFMESERNNILMAAKGTQTEGDATRAMNQIMSNTDLNNQESVLQALRDLKTYKESQIKGNNAYIEALKGSRKLGGTNAPQQPASGEYADDYKKYVAKHGNAMPYAAYAAIRKQKAGQ